MMLNRVYIICDHNYTLIVVQFVGVQEHLNLSLLDLRLQHLLLTHQLLQLLILLLILIRFLDQLIEHTFQILLLIRDLVQ